MDKLGRLGRRSGRGRAHRALASPIRTSFSEGFADSTSDGGFVSFLCAKYSSRSSGFSSIRVGLRLSIRSERALQGGDTHASSVAGAAWRQRRDSTGAGNGGAAGGGAARGIPPATARSPAMGWHFGGQLPEASC